MAITFPTTLDTLNNPNPTDSTATVSHSVQHSNANDAIEALEAKVGVDSSAVTSSLDYKIAQLESAPPAHTHELAAGATDITASATEINYVDGVTSAIQTQLNAKAPIASPTFTGTVTAPTLTITEGTTSANAINFGSDTAIYREGARELRLDGQLAVNDRLVLVGDTGPLRFYHANGEIEFGDSAGNYDTNLYRSAASVLKTDDKFIAAGGVPPRVTTVASSAAPTPNIDTTDHYTITALAEAAVFGAPTGTPTDGQKLVIRIKDNGTARALSFNAAYRFSTDLAAPTTTVLGKTFYLGFIYNSADSKYDNLAQLNNI